MVKIPASLLTAQWQEGRSTRVCRRGASAWPVPETHPPAESRRCSHGLVIRGGRSGLCGCRHGERWEIESPALWLLVSSACGVSLRSSEVPAAGTPAMGPAAGSLQLSLHTGREPPGQPVGEDKQGRSGSAGHIGRVLPGEAPRIWTKPPERVQGAGWASGRQGGASSQDQGRA